jgi:hypothetical protein
MRKLQLCGIAAVLAVIPPVVAGCGDDDDTPPLGDPTGGTSGSAGTAGSGGTGGSGGSAGSGATGGSAGSAGTAGTGGSAGDASVGCGGRPSMVEDLGASITASRTLMADKVYKLATSGTFVQSGATLTIEPCTTIIGGAQSALIITRGAKIEAVGEKDKPIVFTSDAPVGQRTPGGWGGVVILGRAQLNQDGGEAAIEGIDPGATGGRYGPGPGGAAPMNEESSGTLKYVRIEFAGFKFGSNNELNGLTMGSVGSGTVIDYVMVNQPLDDGFEWFGGTVNANHLVVNDTAPAPGGGDDIYDCDFGFTGKVTNFFARKSRPGSNDPNGFEWDNSGKGEDFNPKTNPTFEKGTLCGTDLTAATGGSYGAVFRRRAQGTINQVVWTGWKFAFDVRDTGSTPNPTAVNVTNSIVAPGTEINNATVTPEFDEVMWFNEAAKNNSQADPGFTAADCFAAPGSAEFKKVMDSGKGAFQDDKTWMEGAWLDWAEN